MKEKEKYQIGNIFIFFFFFNISISTSIVTVTKQLIYFVFLKSINEIKEKDKLEMNHSKVKEIYLLKETLIRREDVIHDIMKKYKI